MKIFHGISELNGFNVETREKLVSLAKKKMFAQNRFYAKILELVCAISSLVGFVCFPIISSYVFNWSIITDWSNRIVCSMLVSLTGVYVCGGIGFVLGSYLEVRLMRKYLQESIKDLGESVKK